MRVPSSLASYCDLFERMPDSGLLVDGTSHVILDVNTACARVLGLAKDRIVGRALGQWIEDSARQDFSRALRVAFRSPEPRYFEVPWRISDGRLATFEVQAGSLLLSNQTNVLQILARDVSYRREAEQLVQNVKRQLDLAARQGIDFTPNFEVARIVNLFDLITVAVAKGPPLKKSG